MALNRTVARLLGTVLFIAGSLLIIIIGGEILLRLYGVRLSPPPLYEKSMHSEISYELRPNSQVKAYRSTIATNSLGFRSPKLDPKKPTIVVLGDSITFGYGVEDNETLPAKLRERFSDYNVLNAGVPGYNIQQEVAVYKEKLQPLDPSALLLVFYFNDFDQNTAKIDDNGNLKSADWNGEMCALPENMLGAIPGGCWLDQHSTIYRTVKNIVNTRKGKQKQKGNRDAEKPKIDPEDISREELELYEVKLRELSDLTNGIPRLFVIWPDANMHIESRAELRNMAEKMGFLVVDLYDVFGNKLETLSWDYMHPSPASLSQAASIIADAIEESQALPINP